MENYEATGMSVKQYHDSLLNDVRSRHLLWEYRDKFQRLEEAGRFFMEGNEATLTLKETLEGFLADNDPGMKNEDCLEVIRQAGHISFVQACADILFTSQSNPKERLVWLVGPCNTGKSSFVRLMETIFSTQQFNFKQTYCTMDPKQDGKNWAV